MKGLRLASRAAEDGVDETAPTTSLMPFAGSLDGCRNSGMIGDAEHPELGCARTEDRAHFGLHIRHRTLDHAAKRIVDTANAPQGGPSDGAGEATVRALQPPEHTTGVHGRFEIEALVERVMKQLGGSQTALPAGRFGALFLWRSGHGRLVAACRIAGQSPHAGGRARERKCPALGRAFQSLRAA